MVSVSECCIGPKSWRRSLSPRTKAVCNFVGFCLTCCLIAGLFWIYSHFVFGSAKDTVSQYIKLSAICFAVTAIVVGFTCHLVDPGTAFPDPTDPGPLDEGDEQQRSRELQLDNGKPWTQKWCRECRLWRPYRCGHCHMCGKCVLRLDHHCIWMGTCIGERNMRFFALFLVLAGVGMLHAVVLGVYRLHVLDCWTSWDGWRASWEPYVICFCLLLCPPGPTCFLMASVQITLAGITYMLMGFADVNVPNTVHSLCTGEESTAEYYAKLKECRGVRPFCFGPIALKVIGTPSLCPPCDSEAGEPDNLGTNIFPREETRLIPGPPAPRPYTLPYRAAS